MAAFDGSSASLRAIHHGAILAAGLHRSLVLVHVVAPGASAPTDDDIALRLQDAARDCELGAVSGLQGCIADVEVVIDHGDPVEQMLLGSVSAGVVCGAGRPVMLAGPHS